MADDVAVAEPDHRDLGYRIEPPGNFRQTREAVEEVALIGVAGHHHRRMPTQPCQQHLDLAVGAVLGLVDDDKGVVQCASAHIGDRGDLYGAFGHQLLDPFATEPLFSASLSGRRYGASLSLMSPGK